MNITVYVCRSLLVGIKNNYLFEGKAIFHGNFTGKLPDLIHTLL